MDIYFKLKLHVDRHKYTKGQFAGDAPLDSNRRHRVHARVSVDANRAWVTFHNTRILIVDSRDRTITLNSGGWHDSTTTREAMSDALRRIGHAGYMYTCNHNGLRQTELVIPGSGRYAFYDGMRFDETMQLVSERRPFMKYVADREARKAVLERYAEFRSVLPVLVAACPGKRHFLVGGLNQLSTALDDPGRWPDVVAYYYSPDHKVVWNRIYRELTDDLRVEVPV